MHCASGSAAWASRGERAEESPRRSSRRRRYEDSGVRWDRRGIDQLIHQPRRRTERPLIPVSLAADVPDVHGSLVLKAGPKPRTSGGAISGSCMPKPSPHRRPSRRRAKA